MGILVPLVKQVQLTPMSHPKERIDFPFWVVHFEELWKTAD